MIHIFLPAYNEEIALPRLVEKLDHAVRGLETYKILVLDDGSFDDTFGVATELAKKYPIEALRHEKNLGLGPTIADGLMHLSKITSPDDIIVTMDCDDTHDPQYIGKALEKLREGFDVVILSRYQAGGGEKGLSAAKSLMSWGAGLFLKLFFPIRGVREYSGGYRVMRASAVQKAIRIFGDRFVRLPHMGFVVTPEILIKFRMLGLKISEVPFVLNYDQKPGPSKNRPLRTIAGYFAIVFLYCGRKASAP